MTSPPEATDPTEPAKTVPAQQATAEKVPAQKVSAKKVIATEAPAKRAPAKKVTARKVPAKRATAKRATAKRATARPAAAPTLCIDVGGTGIKGATLGPDGAMLADRVRLDTTYPLPPAGLVDMIAEIARRSPAAERVSIGFPGMVRAGKVLSAPHFVTKAGPGTKVVPELVSLWRDYHLSKAVDERLSLPCRLANDADTQGLAAIQGDGLELVITLGTGIGTAIFLDGELAPHIELSHHPLNKKGTYNEYVGEAARKSKGDKDWSKRVDETVGILRALTFYDRLYIGGGNAERLTKEFTHEAVKVSNADGILGGAKLWTLHRVP